MGTSFLIYIKAVGIYALLTLPALFMPFIYVISIIYVLFYGWIAWVVFTTIYIITVFCNPSYKNKMIILVMGVVVAVLFAFQMLEVLKAETNIWQSGGFLLLPLAAIIAGWISLGISGQKIKFLSRNLVLNFPKNQINNENNLV